MSEAKRIKTALVSVYHKEGLDEIITKLHEEGVEFLSTGGTRQFIESLGFPCKAVEDLTTYPSILGGRVKTLHPKVFGGILCRRGLEQDMQQIEKYEIPEIDLVIVDLYPFEATVASGAEEQAIIEKIDIGGISLIRAAAKNFNDVVIIASQAQYKPFRDMLLEHGATTSREERRWFAKEAFAVSSHYDSAIFNYFDGGEGSAFRCAVEEQKQLRYGENPHQKGYFYGNLDAMFDQIHGKEISYNNLLDINAAVDLIDEFDEVTFAILKHNNACGLASRPTVLEAWKDALAGDPVSAFGGVLVTNAVIDKETAEEINKLFFEVIIAPDYDVDALEILGQKKNRIILVRKEDLEIKEKDDANKPYIVAFQVHNPAIFNMSVKDIAQLSYPKFVISRLWRDGNVSIPTSEKVIKEGDRLLVITSEKNVPALTVLFGEQENTDWNKEDIDWNAIDSQLISQRIVVTRPELNGKKLGSLHLRNHYGINISRVYRSGVLLLATAELTLQLGDRLTVVGEAAAIQNVERVLGNAVKSLKEPNLVAVFVGIILGLALGAIPIAIPGVSTPVKLGLAGGPIIVGILIGTFGPRMHMVTYTTRSANLMLRALGLSLYLACLGLDAGAHFFDTVSRRIAVDSCGLCADGSSCIDYGSYCFSLDEGGLRFGSRYVVWKYGESDGIELCE